MVARAPPQTPHCRSTGEPTTISVQYAVSTAPLESVTREVKLYVPGVVGVPVMAPVSGFRVRPGGSEPCTIANLYGPAPPVTRRLERNVVPTVARLVPQVPHSRLTGGTAT